VTESVYKTTAHDVQGYIELNTF